MFFKEMREYRRDGNIIYAMVILPLVFLLQPLISVFTLDSSSAHALNGEHPLLYLLAIPALVPAALAAYSIVGERLQGTLEPVLTTPVRADELLLGKAMAAFFPAVVISYGVYGFFVAVVELFANRAVASAFIKPADVVAQVVFTPLLATWSIWVGTAISARARDPRTSGQLAVLVSLPIVAVTSLIAFNVVRPTLKVALAFGIALAVMDRVGWRVATAIFDRERLVTGSR